MDIYVCDKCKTVQASLGGCIGVNIKLANSVEGEEITTSYKLCPHCYEKFMHWLNPNGIFSQEKHDGE